MKKDQTLGEVLRSRKISRRGFLKFCAATASLMALPPTMIPGYCPGTRERQTTFGDLAFLSGMHRLHRIVDAFPCADG